MSQIQNQTQNPVDRRSTSGPNILGATGLSRAALAAMFRRDGLFGADSDLTPAEQAVIQAALPPIAGLRPRGLAVRTTPRLAALADYVAALVAGRAALGERARVEAAGLGNRAAAEAATIVANVFAVFEPAIATPAAATPEPVRPAFARAA